MHREPAAFLSYAHADNARGDISAFRDQLAEAVSAATGTNFHIFQDRNDIGWGQQWRQRINESIDAVTFLIPILTPRFFQSEYCRDEVRRFLERERRLQRNDLILPIYFRDHPPLNDEQQRRSDEILAVIATHQYADWRELRYESVVSAMVQRALDRMADQIRDTLAHVQASRPKEADLATAAAAIPAIESSPRTEPSQDAKQGPSSKTEPRTRVVDPLHRGDHPTIASAVAAAGPGERILVRLGLYREGLVIDKPLEIIGDGPPGKVVIEANGQDVILFKTTMGRVANMTLRQLGDREWYGVDVAQGRLELEDCDISSKSFACIAIRGGADPRIRRCRIRDGKWVGVYVYDQGRGTLEDNEVVGNARAGIAIRTG
ncbi:MAG: TIR domain-containing protein, partial [Chloroflexota bacterium]|nr:TIR domain-containing protein [Chloroflexota bacterium]